MTATFCWYVTFYWFVTNLGKPMAERVLKYMEDHLREQVRQTFSSFMRMNY